MAATDIRQSLAAYVKLFEEMTPQSVDTLADYFAPGAVFQDPFNAVRGTEPITRIFQHMYEVCEQPRFRVNSSVLEGARGLDQKLGLWPSTIIATFEPALEGLLHLVPMLSGGG